MLSSGLFRGGVGGQENRPGLGTLGMGLDATQLAAECTPQPFRAERSRLSSALHSIWSHSSWAILSHPGLLPLLGHLLGLRPRECRAPLLTKEMGYWLRRHFGKYKPRITREASCSCFILAFHPGPPPKVQSPH